MIKEIKSPRLDTLVYEIDDIITEQEISIIGDGIEEKLKDVEKVNLMLYINVEGETFGSFVKEFQLGVKYWSKINKIAYLSNKKNWNTLIAIDNLFTKFKEKYFDIEEVDKAWEWIND